MLLNDKINEYIGESMKSGDTKKTETLRLIKSAFLNYTKQEIKDKDGKRIVPVLNEEAEIKILNKLAKQREESIQVYKENNRPELAEKEENELKIIKSFLPAEVSEEEIEKKAIEIIDVKDKSKMGNYIKQLKQIYPNANGKTIADIVIKIIGK